MADIKSPEERSKNMSKIRSKSTAPEEYVRKNCLPEDTDIVKISERFRDIRMHGCLNIM